MGNCGGGIAANNAESARLTKELNHDRMVDLKRKKLLLLGPGNSGKSTFFKQLLQIHGNNNDLLENKQDVIRSIYDSILVQIKALIEQCYDFEYSLDDDTQNAAQYLNNLPRDALLNNKCAKYIEILWNSDTIKKTFENRTNLSVVDSTPYFLENIYRITSSNYEPTSTDILLARTPTTGVVKQHFTIKNHKFTMYDVGGQRSERSKWIHCFDSVTAVLFVASLSCYDQALFELDYVNAMQEALNLFSEICNSRWFKHTAMILFLNKVDLFKIKLKRKSLKICFDEYDGGSDFETAVEYIRAQFKNKNAQTTKQIYSHVTCATDKQQVKTVFNDVQHIVVNVSLERGGLL